MNPHALAGTSPSSWRVCLFRHSDGLATGMQRPEIVARGHHPTSVHGGRPKAGRPGPSRPTAPAATAWCCWSTPAPAPPTAGRTRGGSSLRGVACHPADRAAPDQGGRLGEQRQRDHLVPQLRVRLGVVAGRRVGVELLGGRLDQLVELAVRVVRPVLAIRSCPAARAASCTTTSVWLRYGRERHRQHRQVGELRRQDLPGRARARRPGTAWCPSPPPRSSDADHRRRRGGPGVALVVPPCAARTASPNAEW